MTQGAVMELSLIDEYVAHLHAIERAQATITTYLETLIRADATLPRGLAEATGDELRAWMRRRGGAPASRKLRRAALRSFYRWACDPLDPVIDFDPSIFLPAVTVRPGIARPPGTAAVFSLLDRTRMPYHLWALLAAYQGMRCCEVAACDRGHITPEETLIHGKGGRQRVVPTHEEVWAIVRGMPAGPLARQINGTRANRRDITGRANRHFSKIGHPDIRMHGLRKWYATAARHAGADVRVVQDLLGHASPATTAIYTQVLSAEQRAAVNALPRRSAGRVPAVAVVGAASVVRAGSPP